MSLRTWAADMARQQLAAALPRRWAHVQSVAAEAERIASVLDDDADLLVCAAILHDIGYAPSLALFRFHPLDGARFLAAQGAPHRLCALVAHHSCAAKEAGLRGFAADLDPYVDERTPVRDALWYCDMVTGPDGQRLTVDERLAEIQNRYGPESLVGQFIDLARSELVGAAERTITRYERAGIRQPAYS